MSKALLLPSLPLLRARARRSLDDPRAGCACAIPIRPRGACPVLRGVRCSRTRVAIVAVIVRVDGLARAGGSVGLVGDAHSSRASHFHVVIARYGATIAPLLITRAQHGTVSGCSHVISLQILTVCRLARLVIVSGEDCASSAEVRG